MKTGIGAMRVMTGMAAAMVAALAAPAHAGPPEGAAAEPWQGPAFSASPQQLAAGARSVAAASGTPGVYLQEDVQYSFDASGRATLRTRMVYKVLTVDGASLLGNVRVGWSPWYQERPTIRARVITPDGVEHPLDPHTIKESSPPQSEHVYSDYRLLEAPLPAMGPGSVVEHEIIRKDHRLFFAEGAYRFSFDHRVPVRKVQIVVEGPRSLRIKHLARMLPGLRVTTGHSKSRTRWIFTHGPFEPMESVEASLPSDVPAYPYIGFSTGGSWSKLASRYHRLIEEQIASGGVSHIDIGGLANINGRKAIVAAALAFVHQHVRYTGLEFGESAIVPWTPRDTWSRKYGDCKDQATLLVALLRRLGVPAQVALLRAGTGEDLEPSLPDLRLFNHAIVYVPGKTPIWIDPTNTMARSGELPIPDQGRLALVIGEKTTKLIRTPAARAADNRISEVRDIYVSERGRARVVETTRVTGSHERSYRTGYQDRTDTSTREQLSKYATSALGAVQLSSYSTSDATDLTVPFELTLEIAESTYFETWSHRAEVYLNLISMVEMLPAELLPKKDDDRQRKNDFAIYEPFVHERKYRIHMPPGFAPRELPRSERIALGTASLDKSFRREGDVVEAIYRLDSGPTRLAPAQVKAMRDALSKLGEARADSIVVEQAAMAALQAGKNQQALAQIQMLTDRNPTKAYYRALRAEMLLSAGMGEAARAEARRAVALEPRSAYAHMILGWVLQHDLLGRQRHRGFDHKASVAAYRRAKELAPTDWQVLGDLAILFEHNRAGERYGRGAELDLAIAEYRSIPADDWSDRENNLLSTLFLAKRFAEARELAASMEQSELRDNILLASVAALDGVPRALDEAKRLDARAAKQAASVAVAAQNLMSLRRYPEAISMLREAARLAGTIKTMQPFLDIFAKLEHHERVTLPANTPEAMVYRFFLAMTNHTSTVKALRKLYARQALTGTSDKELAAIGAQARQKMTQSADGMSTDVIMDMFLVMLETRVESAAPWGWVVRSSFTQGSSYQMPPIYVVREGKEYRILSVGAELSTMGSWALSLADKGNLDGARVWLDFASEHVDSGQSGDPLSGAPMASLWRKGQTGTREQMRRAAASLVAKGQSVARALSIMRECAGGGLEALHCMHAIINIHVAQERSTKVLAVAGELAKKYPDSISLFQIRVGALVRLRRWSELAAMTRDFQARRPDYGYATMWLAYAAIGEGDLAAARVLYQQRASDPRAEANDYNNVAWISLFTDQADDSALDAARRAVTMSNRTASSCLNTLAAVHAARGELAEAYSVMIEAMEVDSARDPMPQDWLIYGRIAAGYGLNDIARAAYDRVTLEPPHGPDDSHHLAIRWRAALGK